MKSALLVWAAVPHNSDGVVFQLRLARGLQRFHVSRRVLEEVVELERRATDARQLESFYQNLDRILTLASTRRSIARSDTLALQVSDFFPGSKRASAGAQNQALLTGEISY
jgi:hypothetical protein